MVSAGSRRWAVPVGMAFAAALLVATGARGAVAGAAATTSFAGATTVSDSLPAPAGFRSRPYSAPLRVPDPAGYAHAKARADAAVGAAQGASTAGSPAPSHSWAGIHDPAYAPSDSTSAVGTTRFIELINSDYAIYTRTGTSPGPVGTMTDITGCATSFCAND